MNSTQDVTPDKMWAGRVLFTLLLVAFLVGDFVVTASLKSKELETDGKWKKIQSIFTALQRTFQPAGQRESCIVCQPFPSLHFGGFAQTDCLKIGVMPILQLNGCFSSVFTIFVHVLADRSLKIVQTRFTETKN